MQRGLRVITLQGTIEKSLKVEIWMIGWHQNYFVFWGSINIIVDCSEWMGIPLGRG